MVKGYQTLVDERTTVSYRDGMEAALKLAEALRRDEGEYDPAHMLAEMGRVIDAVREFVPREKWPELQAKLRGKPPPPSQIASARVSQAPPVRPHQRPGRGRVMSECSTCPPGAESVVEYRNGQPDQHDQSQDLRPAPVVKACGTYRHTARPGRRSPTPRPGEAELTRLQSTLRKYEEGRAWEKLNGFPTGRRDELIKHLQDRFDHLAGVPKSTTDPAR
jgi:hypothetical protein